MGKKKKWFRRQNFVEFGMVSIEDVKLPKIDKTPDANWNEFLKELKVSDNSKMIQKKKTKFRKTKHKQKTKNIEETASPPDEIDKQQQQQQQPEITKHIAIDCEMVGVGIKGKEHMLARCSIVNTRCEVIYDKFVKPREEVIDYRFKLSGVTPADLENGEDFLEVQKEISEMISNRILVGHTIRCDLKVLFLDHPRQDRRDISEYKPLKERTQSYRPSLKLMSEVILSKSIQEDHHDSVEDARATMQLYLLVKKEWERSIEWKRRKYE